MAPHGTGLRAQRPWPASAHVTTPGVRLLRGVPYAYRAGIRPLELDLWLPDETHRPLPVVLYLHGGRAGTRTEMGSRFRHWSPAPFARLAEAGFAVASVDYRLTGEAVHPAQLDDATAALGWLNARADELGLDTHRTVAWGESAGARADHGWAGLVDIEAERRFTSSVDFAHACTAGPLPPVHP